DVVQYLPQKQENSFGRFPDGAGVFYPLSAPSPAGSNGPIYSGDIVINELMYNPISGNDDDQYIELYNKGAHSVDLSNWKFTTGVTFQIPQGISIGPGSYLVVSRNVTNLLAKYPGLGADIVLGPFTGKLPHKGGRVALAKPYTIGTNNVYAGEDEVTYETG